MPGRLKAVVIDDDEFILRILEDLCRNSPLVKIIACYSDPRKFLKDAPKLDFDLVLLDLHMPELDGTVLAQMLSDKPFIFITGTDEKLKDALNLSPIDIIIKPIVKDRLNKAFEKASLLIGSKKEYDLFNVAESNRKLKLKLIDIFMITAIDKDPRNKELIMCDGKKYTLMDYTHESLLKMCPSLVQVNKRQLISIEAFSEVDHDIILLKEIDGVDNGVKEITLSRAFKQHFMERAFHRK
jgi:DNA-binding LytR/AlgR family response regulator